MKQVVLFDLGGVLLREAEVNLHKTENAELQRLLTGKADRFRIFNRAFEFAALLYGSDCKEEWLLGARSGEEIARTIEEHIHNPEYDTFFRDAYERELIKLGIAYIITPQHLVSLSEIIEEGVAFVHTCKANAITIGIISNWESPSFAIIKKTMPTFFDLFEAHHVIIPHRAGAAKPSWQIYDYAMKAMNVEPAQCFFIDDSIANVEGAQRYGIESVHHKNWPETKTELIKRGLILKDIQ